MNNATDTRPVADRSRPVAIDRGSGEPAEPRPPRRSIPRHEVAIDGNRVVISNLEEHDAELAAFVGGATDRVEATHQCLRLGARAARAVQLTVDTSLIERRFDDMQSRFDRQLNLAVESVSDTTRDLLDADEGALAVALDRHRSSLETLLGTTFDPDSKKSVIALFDEVMRRANEAQRDAVRQMVSIDRDDSPLGRMKRELTVELRDRLREVKGDLKEISEKIAVTEAVAPVIALSSAKGASFEESLDACLCRIAAEHGDLAERTGNDLGSAATKKGDEVVTLSRDDTSGGLGRIAFEAKTQRLNMRATMAELDAAIANRDAQAAVAVFSDQTLAPTAVPFQYFDNKAIVVLDKDGTDDAALHLAYMWARWVTRRTVCGEAGADFDVERAGRLIDDARRAIERATTIRGSHTKARSAIEQAGLQLDELADAVSRALRELAEELGGDV